MSGYLHRDEVTPIPKPTRREKAPQRGLPRQGKKAKRDRAELDAVKPALLERSGGRCEAKVAARCTGVGVTAHHVQRRAQSGPNDLDNLVWACRACHQELHDNPEKAYEAGLMRRSS